MKGTQEDLSSEACETTPAAFMREAQAVADQHTVRHEGALNRPVG